MTGSPSQAGVRPARPRGLDRRLIPRTTCESAGVLRVEGKRAPGWAYIALLGELDVATAPFADAVLREANADADLVVVDLCLLSFIDCAGLWVLLAGDDRLRERGARMVLIHPARQVARLFALTGASERLELAWAEPEALRTVPASAARGRPIRLGAHDAR